MHDCAVNCVWSLYELIFGFNKWNGHRFLFKLENDWCVKNETRPDLSSSNTSIFFGWDARLWSFNKEINSERSSCSVSSFISSNSYKHFKFMFRTLTAYLFTLQISPKISMLSGCVGYVYCDIEFLGPFGLYLCLFMVKYNLYWFYHECFFHWPL